MATSNWSNPAGGNWTLAGNWTALPTPADDAILDYSQFASTLAYTVTILAAETVGVGSLLITTPAGDGGITINDNGALVVSGVVTATGINNNVMETGGRFTAAGGNFTSATLNWTLDGGSVALFSGIVAGTGITFTFGDGSGEFLALGIPSGGAYEGTITGFQGTDKIDLSMLTFVAGGFTAQQATPGGPLEIIQTGSTTPVFGFAHFNFASGLMTAADIGFHNDGTGGTILTVCFAAGTRIAGAEGEIAVEDLRPGDRVVTLQGDQPVLQPVLWIGRRRLNLNHHPDATLVAPVRILAGAFADGMPHRDLVVSPDHAVRVDGGLIAARRLINQMSIRQETGLASVEYFHVELDRHAILLAEGLAVESYRDTGNRGFFSNARDPLILYPDLMTDRRARAEADPCVPLFTAVASVLPAWQLLHDRAAAAGMIYEQIETTQEPMLRLNAAGRDIQPMTTQAGRFVFAVPRGVDAVRLVSRSAAPARMRPWLDDRRRLGVLVARIRVISAAETHELPIDHPALSRGWWPAEHTGAALRRWTNGDAVIPLSGGPALLEVELAATGIYPTERTQTPKPGQPFLPRVA